MTINILSVLQLLEKIDGQKPVDQLKPEVWYQAMLIPLFKLKKHMVTNYLTLETHGGHSNGTEIGKIMIRNGLIR